MSLEASIEKLIATIEAHTGVLVTMTAKNPAAAQAPATTETPKTNGSAEPPKRRGRPPAVKVEEPELPDDLGSDDGDDLGSDDDLGGDDAPPAVSVEDAKTAVFAYRDKAVAALGDKEAALAATRKILKAHVPAVDQITDATAAAVHKAFTEAPVPKKGK